MEQVLDDGVDGEKMDSICSTRVEAVKSDSATWSRVMSPADVEHVVVVGCAVRNHAG